MTCGEWPPLVPVYHHRLMPSAPAAHGNPVLSFAQPVDTIYCGVDFSFPGTLAPPVWELDDAVQPLDILIAIDAVTGI